MILQWADLKLIHNKNDGKGNYKVVFKIEVLHLIWLVTELC